MFSSALKVLALAAVALALPATESTDATAVELGAAIVAPEVSADNALTLCTGIYPTDGCTKFTVYDGRCFNMSPFHYWKRVVGVRVPSGFICTFFRDFNCNKNAPADFVALSEGIYNLDRELVTNGYNFQINFSKQAASYSCVSI